MQTLVDELPNGVVRWQVDD